MDIDNFSEEEEREIISYGLKQMKSTITMITVLLSIGIVFQVAFESVIFLICFIYLRKYAGGYHADTQERCYVFSTLIFVAACYIIRNVQEDKGFLVLQIINMLLLFRLVPVDNKNRRLEQWEKDKYGRKARIRIIIAYVLYIFFNVNALHGIAIAIGTANLMVGGCVLAGVIKNYRNRLENAYRN